MHWRTSVVYNLVNCDTEVAHTKREKNEPQTKKGEEDIIHLIFEGVENSLLAGGEHPDEHYRGELQQAR